MLFTDDDLASMREAAESLMTDTALPELDEKEAGDFGGHVSTGAPFYFLPFAFPCRLVMRQSGGETEEESRIFARCEWLLRYPILYSNIREGMRLRVVRNEEHVLDLDVKVVVSDRTEPYIQNLAGLVLVR